ncbi:MAG: ATP-dependent RecD-like DNA helicase [Oscillospiraceae bacterium]
MAAENLYIEISGTVLAVIYHNDESGYTVLRLEDQDGGKLTVTGCMPLPSPGELLTVRGNWSRHPVHGEQFKAVYAQLSMPKGAEAIYEYLASGAVRGIGPATAALIVSRFGGDSLNIIENHPEKLAEIKGIGTKKAGEMSESLRRQTGLRRLMEFLAGYGLMPQYAMRLYRFYGNAALDVLRGNPYILASDHIGGSFSEADALALNLGFEADSPERIAAAVVFELVHNSGNGHCFIPREKLIDATAALIHVDSHEVREGLDMLADEGEVVCEHIAGVEGCYLRRLYEAEVYAARRIAEMAGALFKTGPEVCSYIAQIEAEQGISFAPQQRRILQNAARRQVMVITGGPGTGKTTSIRAILALYDRMGLTALLTAPTGRAAKRMSELTGREASTIHRLLEAGFSGDGDEVVFRRDESEPLDCDAVILDECSMVDIELMSALLRAMPPECRLVLVGDADQLPSVGPGNVFQDVIRSGIVETVRLTEIFRQQKESHIVSNAHMINRGEYPNLSRNTGDFFFLRRRDGSRAVDTIVELCSRRLPENMGIDPMDIQVLSPTRRYDTGTYNLNRRLQEALNPPDKAKREKKFGEITFREGDRVMQIKNNYDIMWKKADNSAVGAGIYNGDVGQIVAIDPEEGTITVDFDGRLATYTSDMLPELEHAWAMTVHKSQGSEYRAVILSALKGAPMLLSRAVLYTAVTRAKELLIIVGDDEIVVQMIDNHRQTRRYSGLRGRLAEIGG